MIKIIDKITWANPILRLIIESVRATDDGYDETFVKDPGHLFVKKIDLIIKTITIIFIFIFTYINLIHYADFSNNAYINAALIIFFPYIGNIYSMLTLYLTTILFNLYNNHRKNIIRKINEEKKVW